MTSGSALEQGQLEKIIFGFAKEAKKQIEDNIQKPKKRVIVIAGPTAVGKTKLSLLLAKALNGEIVSADSVQVFRDLDVGTAKASLEERGQVPHHMIDIRDIHDEFNVVDFYFEARQCCRKILERDAVPIIVGGSGFYLHSLIYGPPNGPPSVPEVRKSLEEEMERLGPELMYERLHQLDVAYANSITKNDKQKIVRGLEIIALSGQKVSQLEWKSKRKPQNYDFRCWFLTRPRDKLYQRIEKRCDLMLDGGLVDEVRALEAKGLRENRTACQAIGYRQALDFLKTPQSEEDYEQFIKRFKQSSRQYAKRQFTWFKKESLFQWLDQDLHDPEVAVEMIRQDYEIGL